MLVLCLSLFCVSGQCDQLSVAWKTEYEISSSAFLSVVLLDATAAVVVHLFFQILEILPYGFITGW